MARWGSSIFARFPLSTMSWLAKVKSHSPPSLGRFWSGGRRRAFPVWRFARMARFGSRPTQPSLRTLHAPVPRITTTITASLLNWARRPKGSTGFSCMKAPEDAGGARSTIAPSVASTRRVWSFEQNRPNRSPVKWRFFPSGTIPRDFVSSITLSTWNTSISSLESLRQTIAISTSSLKRRAIFTNPRSRRWR